MINYNTGDQAKVANVCDTRFGKIGTVTNKGGNCVSLHFSDGSNGIFTKIELALVSKAPQEISSVRARREVLAPA